MDGNMDKMDDLQKPEVSLARKRVMAFLSFTAIVTLIAVLGVTHDSSDSLKDKKLLKTADSFWGEPALANNPNLNEPSCQARYKVIFSVDRSSSISSEEALQLKGTLNAAMYILAERGRTLNTPIDVYISFFASSTVNKTPWGWNGDPDVTTARGLQDQMGAMPEQTIQEFGIRIQSAMLPAGMIHSLAALTLLAFGLEERLEHN